MATGTRPNDRAKALLAAQLIIMGETHVRTASILEISPATLTNWKNGPEWEDYLAQAKSVPAHEALAYRARARLFELIASRDDRIALKAVTLVMNNTDFLPVNMAAAAAEAVEKKHDLDGLEQMSDEELREAAGVALDFGVSKEQNR